MIGLLVVVIVLGTRPGAPEVACTNSRCVVVAPAPVPPRAVVVRGIPDWSDGGWRR